MFLFIENDWIILKKKNRRTSTPFKFYKNEKFICKFEGISQAILHEQCSVKSKNS